VWLYFPPRQTSQGTDRPIVLNDTGLVMAVNLQGTQLGLCDTGDVSFSQFIGDWRQRRCFLAASSSGVALADMAKQQLTWLLRQDSEAPLYLLAGARELWAVVPSGIMGIGLDDLALAPGIATPQAEGTPPAGQ